MKDREESSMVLVLVPALFALAGINGMEAVQHGSLSHGILSMTWAIICGVYLPRWWARRPWNHGT